METKLRNILKNWMRNIEHYNKIDNWNLSSKLSQFTAYLRTKQDTKEIRQLVRQIRDNILSQSINTEYLLKTINEVFSRLEMQERTCMLIQSKKRLNLQGQEKRFKSMTKKIFEEKLRYKNGMLLRNFDIETENPADSRKVRRIIEKRMCQAYHRMNKKIFQQEEASNKDRYWEKRATAFQLYNIGQVENIRNETRGQSTHWKKMFDPQTGEYVFKKKMSYSSYEEAMEAIRRWKYENPFDTSELHAYQCKTCHKWHIGHSSGNGSPDRKDKELFVA